MHSLLVYNIAFLSNYAFNQNCASLANMSTYYMWFLSRTFLTGHWQPPEHIYAAINNVKIEMLVHLLYL